MQNPYIRFIIVPITFLFLVSFPLNTFSSEGEEKLSFTFDNQEAVKQWKNIDDVVMGGASKSQFIFSENKTALFKGTVSLENYGGFSSVISLIIDNDLSKYKGIELKVKGDGKRYRFFLKNVSELDSTSYETGINAKKDSWETVKIPFTQLAPTFRVKILTDAPKFDSHNVKSVGFVISEKQEGPFQLEIEYIKAYK